MDGSYDLAESYVIGDRLTDVQLAANLGAKAIWLHEGGMAELPAPLCRHLALATPRWSAIAEFLRRTLRRAEVVRRTAETNIRVLVDLDGGLDSRIETGLHFFDHMLTQLPHHAGIGLQLRRRLGGGRASYDGGRGTGIGRSLAPGIGTQTGH